MDRSTDTFQQTLRPKKGDFSLNLLSPGIRVNIDINSNRIINVLNQYLMAAHNDTGNWGEAKAAAFLVEKGFEIIESNYRDRHSEIDLIVKKDKMLIFVEVKTRSNVAFGMPEEFVNVAKARLVMRAAENYIFEKDWHFDVRFDIVSVLILLNGKVEIRHIEDAFCK